MPAEDAVHIRMVRYHLVLWRLGEELLLWYRDIQIPRITLGTTFPSSAPL